MSRSLEWTDRKKTQKKKTKATQDASDRNKTDLENISTKLECSKTASTMCAGRAVSQASGTSPWPPAPGEREVGLLCCSHSSWMGLLAISSFCIQHIEHSVHCEKQLISRHFTTPRWQRLSDRPRDALLIRMLSKVLWLLLPPDKCQPCREGDHNFRANKIVEWCWFFQIIGMTSFSGKQMQLSTWMMLICSWSSRGALLILPCGLMSSWGLKFLLSTLHG